MSKRKIFLDSDVVISSLISSRGAAYFLINEADLDIFISNISIKEIKRGVTKLNLDKKKLHSLLKNRLKSIILKESATGLQGIKYNFGDYVLDEDDAHIVAGANQAKVERILSYNIRDFKIDKIAEDFKIVVLTPAKFLQYFRGLQ